MLCIICFFFLRYEVPRELRGRIIGVQMAVWQTGAADTLTALAARVPAMMDRTWNPQALRSYADYLVRVNRTAQLVAALVSGRRRGD